MYSCECGEDTPQPVSKLISIKGLTLPKAYNVIAHFLQVERIPFITSDVTLYFFPPILLVGCQHAALLAAWMVVPEAAMYKDNKVISGQNNVWSPRQALLVQPEPIAHYVQHRAYPFLRMRVLALDTAHDLAALFSSEVVGHSEACDPYVRFRDVPQEPVLKP